MMNKKGFLVVITMIIALLIADITLVVARPSESGGVHPLFQLLNQTDDPTPTPHSQPRPTPYPTPRPEPTTTVSVNPAQKNELLGQMVAANYEGSEVTIKLLAVAQSTEIDGIHYHQYLHAKGVYLTVTVSLANLGRKDTAIRIVNLQDSTGKIYVPFSEPDDMGREVFFSGPAKVAPGFVGQAKLLFDIPAQAQNLKMVAFDQYRSNRTPSEQDLQIGLNAQDTQAGSELVGQTLELPQDKLKLRVTRVDRATSLEPFQPSQPIVSMRGIYLVIVLEIENNGTTFTSGPSLAVRDSLGRVYSTPIATSELKGYKDFSKPVTGVKTGQTGMAYTYIEVPKDATGFVLIESPAN